MKVKILTIIAPIVLLVACSESNADGTAARSAVGNFGVSNDGFVHDTDFGEFTAFVGVSDPPEIFVCQKAVKWDPMQQVLSNPIKVGAIEEFQQELESEPSYILSGWVGVDGHLLRVRYYKTSSPLSAQEILGPFRVQLEELRGDPDSLDTVPISFEPPWELFGGRVDEWEITYASGLECTCLSASLEFDGVRKHVEFVLIQLESGWVLVERDSQSVLVKGLRELLGDDCVRQRFR